MSYIPITDNPDFNSNMTALETSTPAYAPTFNGMFQQLLENDVANKRDAKILTDDTTGEKVTLGVDNGLLYVETEDS